MLTMNDLPDEVTRPAIESETEAIDWMRRLESRGIMHHPDDEAATVGTLVDGKWERLFDDEVAAHIDSAWEAVFATGIDPYEMALHPTGPEKRYIPCKTCGGPPGAHSAVLVREGQHEYR